MYYDYYGYNGIDQHNDIRSIPRRLAVRGAMWVRGRVLLGELRLLHLLPGKLCLLFLQRGPERRLLLQCVLRHVALDAREREREQGQQDEDEVHGLCSQKVELLDPNFISRSSWKPGTMIYNIMHSQSKYSGKSLIILCST